MATYWKRQEVTPLYPDAIWAKPERKSQAGKLLIIGGHKLEFAQTQSAYTQLLEIGVGECRVVLPKSAKDIVGLHPDIEFAPSTNQGSISQDAISDLIGFSDWCDTALLPGELGNSSETAQTIEHIINSTSQNTVIAGEALDLLKHSYSSLIKRPHTTLVMDIAQLQELTKAISWPVAIRFQMNLPDLVEQMHELTSKYSFSLAVYFEKNLITANDGGVVTTRLDQEPKDWQLKLAILIAAWSTWAKPEQALATASWQFKV